MAIADKYLKEDITKILNEGVWDKNPRPVWEDGSPAHTKFVTHHSRTYDISKGEFPITEIKPTAIKSAIKEIFWMYQDGSNDLDLLEEKYKVMWWRDFDIGDGTIGRRYGGTVGKWDLMNKLLEGIKNDPYSRRHIINTYQEADLQETEGLYPCLITFLFTVRDEYLDLMLIQRSNDFIGAGNINEVQSVALQMMVAKATGYKPGKFTRIVNNLHIYDRHIEIAEKLLSRGIRKEGNPRIELNTDKTNFFEFTIDDFDIIDYKPQGKLVIPIAV